MINPWYGQSRTAAGLVYDLYYISKAFGEPKILESSLPSVYWLFGLHPLNNQVYVTGISPVQPVYEYSGVFGKIPDKNAAMIKGAIIPGLCLLGNQIIFIDQFNEFRCIEPVVDASATLIFAAFALGTRK